MAYVMDPSCVMVRGMTLFATRVTEWLEHRGLSRYQLAQRMGGPGAEDQLRKWLRGDHEPSGKSVRRVAAALGVSDADFWAGVAQAATSRGVGGDRRRAPLDALAEFADDLALPQPETESRAHGNGGP